MRHVFFFDVRDRSLPSALSSLSHASSTFLSLGYSMMNWDYGDFNVPIFLQRADVRLKLLSLPLDHNIIGRSSTR